MQLPPPIPRETDHERINDDANKPYFSFESDTEDESDGDTDTLLFADSIPISTRKEDTNIRLNIISSRENLLKQRDNIVIFIYQDGMLFNMQKNYLKLDYFPNIVISCTNKQRLLP